MNYTSLFQNDLIEVNSEYASQKEMFEFISQKLYEKKLVKETFQEAIIKREKEYPTGLFIGKDSIAIPHTDVEHIERPFIYVIKLNKTLPFVQMATTEEWVDVNSVFILGIKEPSKQAGLLSQIMSKVQNDQFTNEFSHISTVSEMEAFLKYEFGSGLE